MACTDVLFAKARHGVMPTKTASRPWPRRFPVRFSLVPRSKACFCGFFEVFKVVRDALFAVYSLTVDFCDDRIIYNEYPPASSSDIDLTFSVLTS